MKVGGFWRGSELSAERHLVAVLVGHDLELKFSSICNRDGILGLVARSLGDVLCASVSFSRNL